MVTSFSHLPLTQFVTGAGGIIAAKEDVKTSLALQGNSLVVPSSSISLTVDGILYNNYFAMLIPYLMQVAWCYQLSVRSIDIHQAIDDGTIVSFRRRNVPRNDARWNRVSEFRRGCAVTHIPA